MLFHHVMEINSYRESTFSHVQIECVHGWETPSQGGKKPSNRETSRNDRDVAATVPSTQLLT